MARERYLIHTDEETIHDNQVVLMTKRDKRKNWWHYNKFILLGIIVAALLVGSFIFSIVTKEKPDYHIAFVTSVTLPEDIISDLERHIETYGEDLNGDGKTLVRISSYVFADTSGESADLSEYEASLVRFTADCTTNESMIFIHDEQAFNYISKSGIEGFFTYVDGTPMPEDATDFENAMLSWSACEGLKEFQVKTYESDVITNEEITEFLQRYRISVRTVSPSIERNKDTLKYLENSKELYKALVYGKEPGITEGTGG